MDDHRQAVRRPAGAAAAVLLALGLAGLVGCSGNERSSSDVPSGGGGPTSPAAPGSPATPGTTPAPRPSQPDPTGARAAAAGTPQFHGSLPLTVQPYRQVFVQPSCTPNADGQRFCWAETADPTRAVGTPVVAVLSDAVMQLDDLGSTWTVRLDFAGDGPGRARAAVADAGDRGRLLLTDPRDGAALLAVRAAEVSEDGRAVVTDPLEKAEAWDLVLALGGG